MTSLLYRLQELQVDDILKTLLIETRNNPKLSANIVSAFTAALVRF